eukprot:1140749-Pelagomonas_calceolata.AAC.2
MSGGTAQHSAGGLMKHQHTRLQTLQPPDIPLTSSSRVSPGNHLTNTYKGQYLGQCPLPQRCSRNAFPFLRGLLPCCGGAKAGGKYLETDGAGPMLHPIEHFQAGQVKHKHAGDFIHTKQQVITFPQSSRGAAAGSFMHLRVKHKHTGDYVHTKQQGCCSRQLQALAG